MSIRKVFKDSSMYFWGEALMMVSGCISFPIFTRIFTKYEYGVMSLVSLTVTMVTSVTPLGVIRSTVRFYHKYEESNQLGVFISTLFTLVLSSGVVSIFSSAILLGLLSHKGILSYEMSSFLLLALGWGISQNIFQLLNTTYRMDDQITTYNLHGIINQYTTMIAAVTLVLIFRNLYSYYISILVTGVLIATVLVGRIVRKYKLKLLRVPCKNIATQSVKYGLPLAISAISGTIFNNGDRYVIAHLLSTEHVALYSVPYRICEYIEQMVISCINLSLMPLTYKLWERGEEEEVKRVLSRMIRYFFMGTIPLVFLFLLISKELITLVASAKYVEAHSLMPIIMGGVILSFNFPFCAGFHLKEKTHLIMILTFIMAALNIILNYLLIPYFGIKGAAYATLICGFSLVSSLYVLSRKYLEIQVPYKDLGKFILLSTISLAGSLYFSKRVCIFTTKIVNLSLMVIIFYSVYFLLLFGCDSEIRTISLNFGNTLKGVLIRFLSTCSK